MSNTVDKSNFKYLGEDYQYKLVKELMERKGFFENISPIIDQNAFTTTYLRTYVGTMLDYFKKHNITPSYSAMKIELRELAHTETDIELFDGVIEKIAKTNCDGSDQVTESALRFFKQQKVIKIANEIIQHAANGDVDYFEKHEDKLKNVLSIGVENDYEESCLFDGIDDVLSNDFRTVIPTGVDDIDVTLNGGIGKGELGIIVGPSGYGKVQPYDSLIVTPNGYVQMKDIKVGSLVIGADGKPHKVTAVFPHKDWNFYKVTFSDGASTECGMEHLWNVNTYYQRNQKKHISDDTYKTMSLSDIVKLGLYRGKEKCYNFKIPTTQAVCFEETPITVDPYVMGCMISEGVIGEPSKYHDYLYNSLENRVALLNGLMDTNGSCNKLGYSSYSTKNKQLAEDIKQLVLSLGGFAKVISKKSDDCGFDYKVVISLFDKNIPLFRLEEKQKRVKYRQKKCNRRFIKSVEFSKKCDGQCIMIDSDDHLYLTDDFIVTHNTSMTTSMALHAASIQTAQNNHSGFKVMQIVFEDRIKQIKRKHFSKITQTEACNLSKEEYIEKVREEINKYENKEQIQQNLRIIRLKSGEKDVNFIEKLIKDHINRGFRPDIIFLDYFECIKLTGSSSDTKWEKESKVMRKLEAIANEYDIAFWVPVQGNRDSINAELVTMDNAGGSLGKIQIGHIIISITRTLDDIASNVATMSVLKNRAGSSGKVFEDINFNNGTCTIGGESTGSAIGQIEFTKRKSEKKEEETDELTKGLFDMMKKK